MPQYQKGVAAIVPFVMRDATGALQTGRTILSHISKDGSAMVAPSSGTAPAVELEAGGYYFNHSAADMNANQIAARYFALGTPACVDTFEFISTEADLTTAVVGRLDAAISSRQATVAFPANFSLLSIDSSGRVTVGSIIANAITSAVIQSGALTAGAFATDALAAAAISAAAVTKIQAGLATFAELPAIDGNGFVTVGTIAANAVNASALATDAVTEIITAIEAIAVESGVSLILALQAILAVQIGKSNGVTGGGSVTFKNPTSTKTRVTQVLDTSGNRTSDPTLDGT